jgi:hypothetical protein
MSEVKFGQLEGTAEAERPRKSVIEDMRLAADDMQNWLLSRYKQ